MIDGFCGDTVDEGQRIHAPAAALIYPFLQKHGILVRRQGEIGRNSDRFRPCFDRAGLIRRCIWQFESLQDDFSSGCNYGFQSKPNAENPVGRTASILTWSGTPAWLHAPPPLVSAPGGIPGPSHLPVL